MSDKIITLNNLEKYKENYDTYLYNNVKNALYEEKDGDKITIAEKIAELDIFIKSLDNADEETY